MSSVKESKKGHTYFQWIFALLANTTLLAHGLDVGWISPTTKILQSENSPTGHPLSDYTISWIATSLSIGAMLGVSFYSYVADAYGRKLGIILIAIPEAISWIIKLLYNSTTTLIISRIFCGIAAGGCFNVVPMYIKEISEDHIRGILGTMSLLLQTLGLLIMYLLGAYWDYFTVVKVVLGLPIITAVTFTMAPESPAFLVMHGKLDEASKSVAMLRGLKKDDETVQKIVETMKKEDAYFKSLPSLTITSILKEKPWRRGVILIAIMITLRVMSGAYSIITYAATILISTGVEYNISPEVQTLSFPIVIIVGSLTLTLVVERFARKTLSSGAFFISFCSMSAIAILIIIKEQGGYIPSWLSIILILISVMMWAGISSLPFIIMTEMFSFRVRARIMGIVLIWGWFATTIVISLYVIMVNAFGECSPFVLYAIVNLIATVFTLVFLPETKGRSEDEIFQILKGEKPQLSSTI